VAAVAGRTAILSGDSSEFLEHVKVDLFPGEVYVFSPKGKIFALPRGSTVVDLAYAVHTDIGDQCVACRINFETMPLRTELRNGDRVEIITAPHAAPNPAWLELCQECSGTFKDSSFFNTKQNEESAAFGERLLSHMHCMRPWAGTVKILPAQAWERFKRASGVLRSKRAVLSEIGLGKRCRRLWRAAWPRGSMWSTTAKARDGRASDPDPRH
jgi:guanosine-3',5'-bis(diphosphate) 3'-pyrophosphohydrolase